MERIQRLFNAMGFTYFAFIITIAFLLVCTGHLLTVLRTPAVFEELYSDSLLFTLDKSVAPLDKVPGHA